MSANELKILQDMNDHDLLVSVHVQLDIVIAQGADHEKRLRAVEHLSSKLIGGILVVGSIFSFLGGLSSNLFSQIKLK